MFQRILVPIDLTERARKALDLALALGTPGSSRVTVLHVIETIRGLDGEEMKPFYQKLEKKAEAIISAVKDRLPKTSIEVTHAIVYGEPAEEIIRFATAQNANLIVLASHRVNPSASGRDWGTISHKVGVLAQCPVLLVK